MDEELSHHRAGKRMETKTQHTGVASITFDRAAALKRVLAERRRSMLIDLSITLLTILLALGLGFIVMLIVGKDPIKAYTTLLTWPSGPWFRTGRWLEDATSLILLGLSVSIAFRARQFSLGAEAQLYMGVLVGGAIAIYVPLPPGLAIIVPAIAAMIAGFLVGIIPGLMKAHLNANEIVSTLMINAIVVRVYDYILTFFLTPQGSQTRESLPVLENAILTKLGDLLGISFGRVNIGVIFPMLAVIGVWLLMTRTKFGYEVRTIGANEKFARYGGIDTKKSIIYAFAIGGAIAALAGLHLVLGVHRKMIPGISAGLAFEGITVALLARNNPLLVPVTGLFYAYLRTGGDIMEQQASVGSEIVQVIQAVIILLITAQVLVQWVKNRRSTTEEK
jgi:simple sugar transport system permease protein